MQIEPIHFKYKFRFKDHSTKMITVNLNPKTLACQAEEKEYLPAWTKLECHQCPNCPLNAKQHVHCPVAVNLVDTLNFFADNISEDNVEVTIETSQRNYSKTTKIASTISSLIAIYMVTSGCPVLDKLRPMVRFHLPFASTEETMYRAVTMYLMAQYFLKKHGKIPDWDMKNLTAIYKEIEVVNRAFSERLKEIESEKPVIDAITTLDCFAYYINLSLSGNMLSEFENLYKAYLD